MGYIALPPQVTAIPVPVADGGTNSTTALSSNRFMVSSSGKVAEASAVTASRIVVSDSNGLPTANAAVTASRVVVSDSNGFPSAAGITSTQVESLPFWTKYTTGHAALQTAGLTNNITLFTLPAKTLIHKIILKQTTAFAGTLIATYTISIGIAGSLTKYIAIYDVMAAVASSTFGAAAATINATLEDFSSGVAIKISAVSTVANLDQSTAGSVDTYVLTSLLP